MPATPIPTAKSGGSNAAGPPNPLPGSLGSDPPTAGPTEDAGGNGGGDPGGAAGNNEGDPSPGTVNTQGAAPVDGDPPLSSIENNQIQKTEGGGIVIGSTTLRPGGQTTRYGTPLSVGSDHAVIGDSTILLVAPTGDVWDPDSIVMAASDPVIVGGNTVDRLSGGGVLIAGSTYSPGSHTTISGVSVSVAADNRKTRPH